MVESVAKGYSAEVLSCSVVVRFCYIAWWCSFVEYRWWSTRMGMDSNVVFCIALCGLVYTGGGNRNGNLSW